MRPTRPCRGQPVTGSIAGVTVDLTNVRTVLLPGTGSDDEYLRRAFGGPLRRAGAHLVAVRPQPEDLLAGYRRALDAAAVAGPIAVGGVSLGAAMAAAWALANPGRVVAVLAALPPWSGAPGEAPGAVSARHTAALLRHEGLAATTAAMREGSPGWLAEELSRSWRHQWPRLPEAMEEAAAFVAPTTAELAALSVPMGIAACPDDPVHPIAVALDWAAAAPRSAVRAVTLLQFGPRPEKLGEACLEALAEAG